MMESFGVFEDMSLFNGDLLPDDVDLCPAAENNGFRFGTFINEAVQPAPVTKPPVHDILAHPQNGSCKQSLEDLLAPQPTQDLPDPFDTFWMENNSDLVDILTSPVQNQHQHLHQPQSQAVGQQQIPSPAQMVPQGMSPVMSPGMSPVMSPQFHVKEEVYVESLEEIQSLLLAAEQFTNTDTTTSFSSSRNTSMDSYVYLPDAHDTTETSKDIMQELNGLDQFVEYTPAPNTASLLDVPTFSPVSAEDVESLLSSSPQSPSEDQELSDLFNSFTDGSITLNTVNAEDLSSVGPQRSVRQKARSAPYTVSSAASSPAPSTSASPRKAKGDRRERKKAQNRTAALRYREKKKTEQEILDDELAELTDETNVMKDKVDSMEREIQYLKDLIGDVKKARSKANKK